MRDPEFTSEQVRQIGELSALGAASFLRMADAVRHAESALSGVREERPTVDAMRWRPEDAPDCPVVR